jgi:Flp pilus assembly protein TadD
VKGNSDLIRDRFGSSAAITLFVLALAACTDPNGPDKPIAPLQTDQRSGGHAAADYDSLMRVAAAMRDANDLESAVGVYREAGIHAPQLPMPLILLGDTLLELGQYNEASQAYEGALRLSPQNSAALVGQGRALLQSDRPQLALAPLRRELAAHPENLKAITALGVAQDLTGDHATAQHTYRDALLDNPNNPALTGDLALSLAIEGYTDEAIKLLAPLASGSSSTPRLRQNLALIYGLAGDREDAQRTARLDLDEDAVQHNLAYFETLRSLPIAVRTRAILAAPVTSRTATPSTGAGPGH